MRRAILTLVLVVGGCDGDLRFDGPAVDSTVDTHDTAGECTRDEQCPLDGRRRCDVASQRCVECGVTADCDADEICEPTTKQCMKSCTESSTCYPETPFCDPRGVCVCTATSCVFGDHRVCAPNGRCVECTSDAQCDATEPHCDVYRGECTN